MGLPDKVVTDNQPVAAHIAGEIAVEASALTVGIPQVIVADGLGLADPINNNNTTGSEVCRSRFLYLYMANVVSVTDHYGDPLADRPSSLQSLERPQQPLKLGHRLCDLAQPALR